jgi:uncharacterized protein
MIRRMLDVLVCPFDKKSALELYEFIIKEKNIIDETLQTDPVLQNSKIKGPFQNEPQISDNDSIPVSNIIKGVGENKNGNSSKDRFNHDVEIEEGILYCNQCLRFYPIFEEIPIILPDELRDKEKDLLLLKKWSKILPEKIVKKALPWHL